MIDVDALTRIDPPISINFPDGHGWAIYLHRDVIVKMDDGTLARVDGGTSAQLHKRELQ